IVEAIQADLDETRKDLAGSNQVVVELRTAIQAEREACATHFQPGQYDAFRLQTEQNRRLEDQRDAWQIRAKNAEGELAAIRARGGGKFFGLSAPSDLA